MFRQFSDDKDSSDAGGYAGSLNSHSLFHSAVCVVGLFVNAFLTLIIF